MERKIEKVKNHYIICGYGRIGRVLCQHLCTGPSSLVVVDRLPENVPQLEKNNYLYIIGEATNEDILKKAGIDRARGLISVLGADTDNVFVTLTARELRHDLFIMARANELASEKKLMTAGASRVISPYEIAGRRMANSIIRPTVTDFIDLTMGDYSHDIQMEEIPVHEESELSGVTLANSQIRQRFNLIIIAIKKADGTMLFNPSFEARILPGDTVIAVGERKNLSGLEKTLIGKPVAAAGVKEKGKKA